MIVLYISVTLVLGLVSCSASGKDCKPPASFYCLGAEN